MVPFVMSRHFLTLFSSAFVFLGVCTETFSFVEHQFRIITVALRNQMQKQASIFQTRNRSLQSSSTSIRAYTHPSPSNISTQTRRQSSPQGEYTVSRLIINCE